MLKVMKGKISNHLIVAFIIFLVVSVVLWTNYKVDAEPKDRTVVNPAVYVPATVLPDETIRVNVFNDDRLLEVSYEIQIVDGITGAIIEQRNTGPVQPLSGVVEDHIPHSSLGFALIVSIRGLVDPDGDGLSDDHPVSISSVEILDPTTNIIRFVPVNSHTYGSGTGAH